MAKNKIYAVIGLGVFGTKVAEVLAEKGAEVIVFDNNADRIERMKNKVTSAVLLDATDETALMKAPLDDVDAAVVAIGDNMEASILTTALMKRRGIPYILSRAVSDIHETILRQVGANEVVNPEVFEGTRTAQRIFAPEIYRTIPVSQDFSMTEILVPKPFIGRRLADLKLREKYSVNVISVKRTSIDLDAEGNPRRKETLLFPKADDDLKEKDVLFLLGKNDDLESLGRLE